MRMMVILLTIAKRRSELLLVKITFIPPGYFYCKMMLLLYLNKI